MNNPFVNLKQSSMADPTGGQVAWKLSDEERKQKREALYAEYSPMVDDVLDQLIVASRPGIWKRGSDSDHEFCCHCRWYAGPEETGHAGYDDHTVRRRIEIELEINHQCHPTGFKILYHDNPGECVHVGRSQDELVRGIKLVLHSI